MQIEEEESVKFWMDELTGRSNSTKEGYKRFLHQYCEWLNTTPDQLIEERKTELKSDKLEEQRRAEINLKKYVEFLKSQGKSIGTQKVAYSSIRSFYTIHYLDLKLNRSDSPQGESGEVRAPSKKELNKMLQIADLRDRAIILFLKDSGLRISDAARLKLKEINMLEDGSPINIQIRTKKKKIMANTFIGDETIEGLKLYLEMRKRGTSTRYGAIEKGYPPENLTPESPLFRSTTTTKTVTKLTSKALGTKISNIASMAGILDITAHSLRRYFQTNLEGAGVHINWIRRMMGKKPAGSDDSYSKPTTEMLKEAYIKAYDSLRTYTAPTTPEEDVEQLKEKIALLEERVKRSDETVKRLFKAAVGEEIELKLIKVKEEGKAKARLVFGLPEKAMEGLRNQVVKVKKGNIDKIVELIKQGYEKQFENEEYVIFGK